MYIQDIVRFLDEIFPPAYAETFDNTGLLTGDPQEPLKGILVSHDTTEAVVEEALAEGKNLIVSFHPIIFHGLKRLTGRDYVERTVMKAIRHGIAVYSPHTAMDNHLRGVSYLTLQKLGLKNIRVLLPREKTIAQLVTYVPHEQAEKVRSALFSAGAGHIGNYEECSYNLEGYGTFKAKEGANPFVGEINQRHTEPETRISVIFPVHLQKKVLHAMYEAHPYEEPAYEIFITENDNPEVGIGSIGEWDKPMAETDFLDLVKEKLQVPFVKHSELTGKKITKVASVGGSGSFAIDAARQAGADVFITGDLKYHDFFKAENQILLVDAGHYETERFVCDHLVEILSEKFSKFAVTKSKTNTNPVNYY